MIVYVLFACGAVSGQPAAPCYETSPPQVFPTIAECRVARHNFNEMIKASGEVGSMIVCMKRDVPTWQPVK